MTFLESIRTCLRKFATFSGRAARSEFWWFVLFVVLVAFALSFVDAALLGGGSASVDGDPRQPITGLWQLLTLLPLLAAAWRRMHDTGRPGWYALLPMIVSVAVLFFLMIGVAGFGLAGRAGADAGVLGQLAGAFGAAGALIFAVAMIFLPLVLIWWLTRPSEPVPNAFGPPPHEVHP